MNVSHPVVTPKMTYMLAYFDLVGPGESTVVAVAMELQLKREERKSEN